MADLIERKAAIKAIEDLQDCYNGFSDTYDKACIIGVLEEIPTAQVNTPTDTQTDIISRQAAIDFIDAGHLCNPNEPRWSDNEVVNFLKSRPSAQPDYDLSGYSDRLWKSAYERGKAEALAERKTGRWIIKENPGTKWYKVTCSACGEDVSSVIPTIGFFPNVKALWDFCPNCGARMEVEE